MISILRIFDEDYLDKFSDKPENQPVEKVLHSVIGSFELYTKLCIVIHLLEINTKKGIDSCEHQKLLSY